jgi:aerobic-type carbon monoxide dehydrogenase small subunit (CoxS/CutS family)
MLMAATHLLAQNPHPSITEIREALAGNLCRCTGFIRIFESVISAAASYPAEPMTHGRVHAG